MGDTSELHPMNRERALGTPAGGSGECPCFLAGGCLRSEVITEVTTGSLVNGHLSAATGVSGKRGEAGTESGCRRLKPADCDDRERGREGRREFSGLYGLGGPITEPI